MKIRNGFVSNSSSSSFVLSAKLNSNNKIEIDPKAFGSIFKTKEEYIAKLKERCYSQEDIDKNLKQFGHIFEEGKVLFTTWVDNGAEEEFESLIQHADDVTIEESD